MSRRTSLHCNYTLKKKTQQNNNKKQKNPPESSKSIQTAAGKKQDNEPKANFSHQGEWPETFWGPHEVSVLMRKQCFSAPRNLRGLRNVLTELLLVVTEN